MASGFNINRRGIEQMTREIQREFDKNPIRVPIEAETPEFAAAFPPAPTVNNYNGPVVTVNGDQAQLAWSNTGDVTQNQTPNNAKIADGYEQLAQVIADLLANLETFSLHADEETEVRDSAETALQEVTSDAPNPSTVKRAVRIISGVLAPIVGGIGNAVTQETADAARIAIEGLTAALPF